MSELFTKRIYREYVKVGDTSNEMDCQWSHSFLCREEHCEISSLNSADGLTDCEEKTSPFRAGRISSSSNNPFSEPLAEQEEDDERGECCQECSGHAESVIGSFEAGSDASQ